jgi:hypothetical protein
MMDARKIDKVDRAVVAAATSMLNNGGEAANYLSIARRSGRSTFSATHCGRKFPIV